jgi:hypothetical protein
MTCGELRRHSMGLGNEAATWLLQFCNTCCALIATVSKIAVTQIERRSEASFQT